ncbi:uncharacterized protein LOC124139806 [Haliotis rufescens]|uniref:uncharacterized protein LOC124139806 n=1 Tax=Haliotis rufescens TaxID=6454 RepID=UPI001EB04C2A|nr:uncharacterized protein LOC124139806 [Haliotis rufescens]
MVAKLSAVGSVMLLAGLLAHIVSFCSPYWLVVSGVDFGLWQVCVRRSCVSFLVGEVQLTGWFHAVQATTASGLLFTIVAFVTSVINARAPRPRLSLVPGTFVLIAAIQIGVGAFIYAVKQWSVSTSLGWAFYLECGAVGALVLASVPLFISAAVTRSKSRTVDLTVRFADDPNRPTTEL